MVMNSNNRWKAIGLVLLGAASYGILSTFVKLGYSQGFTPAEITGSQVLFGCIIMWICSAAQFRKITDMTWPIIGKLLLSGTFTGLTGYFYYLSLQTLDASLAILLLFQFTWIGMLLDALLEKRGPSRYQWIGMAVIMTGTIMASGMSSLSLDQLSVNGILLALLAACCYTLFICFSGRVATQFPALTRSAWMITGAAMIVLTLMPPQFLWNGALEQGLWKWGILLSLFGMVVPPYLFAKGAPLLTTSLSAVLGSVELPVVIVCSALLLHEGTSIFQWIGIAMIIAGIVVSEIKASVSQTGSSK
jgi:drug/metabolite transporter (DMT)-like permease